ncbi:hypothetical protein K4K49_009600 [Colletotrichum sp. SAR 10_70]|nr:hypothetical protein K4K50_004483 [Colletotrichum sp. SAR 10_71]KAI8183246.1 hypothetical protein K4K51_000360 [Colletotrichum sp. SAR 10_75]KAI8194485.1 hypothetical protein K4K49_009600 [Colletotrichum sp. SAR 10_70]KAI8199150.1 hypothetical protein KHU50_007937 [Colletotrichum sp. SAR 10_65]KAI8229637.1 hypothetical protein K4K54_001407 [Colletotrichum sp. SAR 10_86]KAJ5003338.1 hypothetical protein K4K48_012051 [Colletotrichum sp. SAR 10_66]
MNNFGVYELASAKTTSAPGWAYVPDTGVNPAAAALQPANRKRAARTKANPSASDLNVRQEAKIRKELEALDKDWGRDATIPIPAKGGSRENTPAPHPNQHTAKPANKPPHPNQHTKRNAAKRSKTSTPKPAPVPEPEDVEMAPAPPALGDSSGGGPVLAPYDKPLPPAHPGDEDPLLVSRVPEPPTDEELRWLLAQPMLSFWDARAEWADEDTRYPERTFCEVCGYWGRVKCMKCGTRVCALDCLETHREECATRYGY